MEEYNKRVSVVIPIYNVEGYIEKCLESVIHQTLKEIEIICVNDGSTDHSMDVVLHKAKEDSRIVVIQKENGGLSSARNAGMDVASGEYVLFLDSDDALVSNALELLYERAAKNQLDNIYFEAEPVYESLSVKLAYYHKYNSYYRRKCEYPAVLNGTEMLCTLMENQEYRMSACLQMIKRQFLLEKGIRFYEGILHEDNLFSLQVILAADRVMVLREALYIRLMRGGSIMTAKGYVESSWGYFICLQEMIKYVANKDYAEKVRRSIHAILRHTQREAVLPIRGMKSEEVLASLSDSVSEKDRLAYEIAVLNGEWMRQQRSLKSRMMRRINK